VGHLDTVTYMQLLDITAYAYVPLTALTTATFDPAIFRTWLGSLVDPL